MAVHGHRVGVSPSAPSLRDLSLEAREIVEKVEAFVATKPERERIFWYERVAEMMGDEFLRRERCHGSRTVCEPLDGCSGVSA